MESPTADSLEQPMTRPPATEHRVAAAGDLAEGARLIIDIGDVTIGLFRVDSAVFAYRNVCPHQGGPACQGRLVPRVRENLDDGKRSTGMAFDESDPHVVCPWHGLEFSIKTGHHVTNENYALERFPSEEREGHIYVRV
jgi:nitrite reductase/ring-hydroxylating ferredoxin subunit